MTVNRAALIEKIRKAFENTPPPKDGIAGYELDALDHKNVLDITFEDLEDHQGLKLFYADGLHYFLPAILSFIILRPEELIYLSDEIIYVLAPREPDDNHRDRFERLFRLLSFEEKQAIAAFLNAYRDLRPEWDFDLYEAFRMKLDRAIDFWRSATE